MKQSTSLRDLIRRTNDLWAGNWGPSFAVVIIVGFLICGLGLLVPVFSKALLFEGLDLMRLGVLIVSFLPLVLFAGPLATGTSSYFLSVAENDHPKVGSIFQGFERFKTSNAVFLLTAFWCFLWCLLLAIIVFGGLFGLSMLTKTVTISSFMTSDALSSIGGAFGLLLLVVVLFAIVGCVGLFWVFFRHSLVLFAFVENPEAGAASAAKHGLSLIRGHYGILFRAWGLLILLFFLLAAIIFGLNYLFMSIGFPRLAVIFESIIGIYFGLFVCAYPMIFLAVLYEDVRDK
ncbi:MAG: hypothetical protein ISR85_05685 [Kiritimatiellales bacterium]|nr:hypothetical protein [Kiritimatiellota bacterium]MBL7012403.1 hypothetical protein [Kiritimatiellales bacterium]